MTISLSECGFRLTLSSSCAVPTTDVSGSVLYFTPHINNRIALFNGAYWQMCKSDEMSINISGSVVSGSNYDVFCYNKQGSLALELSNAWLSNTARANAITQQDGVWCKSGALTRRFVGTFKATSASTTEDSTTNRNVWNLYNQTLAESQLVSPGVTSSHGIVASSTGGSSPGAQLTSSYVTVLNEPGLTGSRQLTQGTGIKIVDSGAGSNVTVSVNDGVVATLSGSSFSGPVVASSGLTGSLTQVSSGVPYILGQGSVTVTTNSSGQVLISGSGGGGGGSSNAQTTGSMSWQPIIDIDFSQQPSQTLGSDTTYSIGGYTWTKYLSTNDQVAMAIVSGSGLVMQPKVGGAITDVYAGQYSAPTLYIPLTSLLSTIDLYTPVRVLMYVSAWNGVSQYDAVRCGVIDTVTKTDFNTAAAICNRPARNSWFMFNYSSSGLADMGIASNDDVFCLALTLGVEGGTFRAASCAYSTSGWPPDAALLQRSCYTMGAGAGTVFRSIANYAAALCCGAGGDGTAGLSATIKKFRVEVPASVGAIATNASSFSFVTVANESSGLAASRRLVSGSGIKVVDSGAGSNITLSIDNSVVATLTGSTFSGPVVASGGLTGSLTQAAANTPYIVGQGSVSVSTNSSGQVLVSGSRNSQGWMYSQANQVSINAYSWGSYPPPDAAFYEVLGCTHSLGSKSNLCINATVPLYGGGGNWCTNVCRIKVDGVQVGSASIQVTYPGFAFMVPIVACATSLAAGSHTISVEAASNGGATANYTSQSGATQIVAWTTESS